MSARAEAELAVLRGMVRLAAVYAAGATQLLDEHQIPHDEGVALLAEHGYSNVVLNVAAADRKARR